MSHVSINRSRQRAFTLLEIMIVVVIIGLLAGISGMTIVNRMRKSKDSITKTKLGNVKLALYMYCADTGTYPTQEDGLNALLEKPDDIDEYDYNGPYFDDIKALLDAWNQLIIYKVPSEHGKDFDLISKGADRREGTSDDIIVWTLKE
jgi:general secretion pathway protein G